MELLTMPVATFEAIATTLLNGDTNKCVQLRSEDSIWTMGIAVDQETGQEMFQIIREPVLVIAKN